MASITKKLGVDRLSAPSRQQGELRKDIDPTYKSNRRKTRKPLGYAAMKTAAQLRHHHETRSGRGRLPVDPEYPPRQRVHHGSDDKDMLGCPGQLFDHPLTNYTRSVSKTPTGSSSRRSSLVTRLGLQGPAGSWSKKQSHPRPRPH